MTYQPDLPDESVTSPYVPNMAGRPLENNMAVAALVLGIIGAALSIIPFIGIIGFILGILAAIFGHQGVRRASTIPSLYPARKGMAMTGLVFGYVAIAVAVIVTVLVILGFAALIHYCQNAAPGDCG